MNKILFRRAFELTARYARLEANVQRIKTEYIAYVSQGAHGQLPQLPEVNALWSAPSTSSSGSGGFEPGTMPKQEY